MKPKSMSFPKILKRTLSYGFQKLPGYFVYYILISLCLAALNFLSIDIIKRMFDTVSLAFSTGVWEGTISIILLGGLVLVLFQFISGYHSFLNEDYFLQFISKILKDMNAKAGRLELIEFESIELYEKISLAIGGVHHAIKSTILLLNGVIFHLVFFISISVYFFSIKPILVLLCFLFFIPKFISQLIKGSNLYKLQEDLVQTTREMEYYQKCLTDKEYYKETKTLEARPYFFSLYQSKLRECNQKEWKANLKIGMIDLLLSFITYLGYIGSFVLITYFLLKGELSIGIFAAVYYSLNKLMNSMSDMMELFGSIYQNANLAGKLYDYLEIPENPTETVELPPLEKITLRDVSFTYPYRNKESLKNINLEIYKGSKLAIVGANGSGKTTLVKIITGLFQTSGGEIFYNDINLSGKQKNLYSKISAVFQNFGKYKLTLRENVILSEIEKPYDVEYLNTTLDKSGFNRNKDGLTEGVETMMCRSFGGIDLSGGEWQRLAIARGLYKTNDLIVLDEPTSAIDPIEETNVYKRFNEISKDKTTIFVTHRLASVKSADRIIVMDSGAILEEGSHEQLIALKGKYHEMYMSQAEWYVR
ncbi:ABC transporter ATP-binding protein [Paenibacillus sp. FSL R7-0302]|uniref:ABC transporter ATP-binding protein n=1 Tax=Paenibacillus sp. FSL R7-0302 TaxID=2921681 RepID=UPI0030F86891